MLIMGMVWQFKPILVFGEKVPGTFSTGTFSTVAEVVAVVLAMNGSLYFVTETQLSSPPMGRRIAPASETESGSEP
jgi:hypothetical protein